MKTEALKKWREENPRGVAHGPPKNPWQKWQEHNTRKTAIAAKCWDCMGGDQPGIRASIKDCTSTGCPLYDWRPYK